MSQWTFASSLEWGERASPSSRLTCRRAFWRGVRIGIAVVVRAWLRVYHRLSIQGSQNLPQHGTSFVIVANHASHLDTLCLLAALPLRRLHRAYAAAAADYFFVSAAATAVAVLACNALPFQRRNRARLRQSLSLCRTLLRQEGSVLILYPEGTRSADGRIQRFRPGIGALLAGTPVAAVPCYLEGTDRALGKGRWIPRPRKIRLVIGQPRRYAGVASHKTGVNGVRGDLEAAGRELAGATTPHDDDSDRANR
jgi:1-acyl-sn-glycerol-3-phosphate acyltransferase